MVESGAERDEEEASRLSLLLLLAPPQFRASTTRPSVSQHLSTMANLGTPIRLLHESLGHVITLELKTGQVYRGKLYDGALYFLLQLYWGGLRRAQGPERRRGRGER